jgi:hypothetical protein
MTIRGDGYIGIGNVNPGNILQVGDGARLRISNGPTDFTSIGSKEGDVNNTKIVISGHQRSGFEGDIEYYATTAVGIHAFIANNTQIFYIDTNEVQSSRKFTVFDGNYYTNGQYIPFSTGVVNTAGQSRNGYFLTTEAFFSSFVNLSLSHNGNTYTYWSGSITTGNNTQIISINNVSNSQMAVEHFIQQTTLKSYLLIYPTITFSSSILLRVKFYG